MKLCTCGPVLQDPAGTLAPSININRRSGGLRDTALSTASNQYAETRGCSQRLSLRAWAKLLLFYLHGQADLDDEVLPCVQQPRPHGQESCPDDS